MGAMFASLQTFLTILFFLAALLLVFLRFQLSGPSHPPGPKGLLISGNSHQLSRTEPWKTYAKWSQEHGPIFQFRSFRRKFVVLNTAEATTELLEKRSAIYSDRPMSWMLFDLVGRGLSVFNISSSDKRHKIYRKVLHSGLSSRVVQDYWPALQVEAGKLVQNLLDNKIGLEANIRLNAGAVIMMFTYGYKVENANDNFIAAAEETSQLTGKAMAPGRWLVESFPLLRFVPSWMPGAHFKRQASVWRRRFDFLSSVPHEWVKKQIAAGKYADSFTSKLLVREDGTNPNAEEEDIINWCGGALYSGAADTTVSALLSFVMIMAVHPEVQARAQVELDTVIGKGRQASYTDLSSLPYLSAVLKETLRFAPVGPLALPHKVTKDDEYLGYRISKDTTIFPNVWSILHDTRNYPDPFTFNPDRFMELSDHDEKSGFIQPDPRKFSFGFGSRTCPGSQFAEKWLLLNMASILSSCTISFRKDVAQQVDRSSLEFTTGITSHVRVFDCTISHR